MTNEGIRQEPQVLSGWKDIARYLGKGVRTVQRYEWEFALPVRRPAGKPRGSVIATKQELDAWIAASPIRDAYQLKHASFQEYRGSVATIRSGVDEMRRLRGEMAVLRAEAHASLLLLQENILGLGRKSNPVGDAGFRSSPSIPGGPQKPTSIPRSVYVEKRKVS